MRSAVFEEQMEDQHNEAATFPVQAPEGADVIHNPTATGNETEDVSE